MSNRRYFNSGVMRNIFFALSAVMLSVLLSSISPAMPRWKHYYNNDDIRALYRKGDTLWIGTNGGVLLYDLLLEEIVGRINAGSNLASNSVRVISGRGDDVYVGTDLGFSIFSPQNVLKYSYKQCRCFRDTRDINFGFSNEILLGTFGHGVTVLRDGRLERITRADSLLDNKIYAILPQDSQTYYFATSLGLCALKDSAWISYQAGSGLPRGEVTRLISAGHKRFYLAVKRQGLFLFRGRRARRISTGTLFPENDIAALALAQDQSLFAAGSFGGIGRYAYGHWSVIGEGDPDLQRSHWRSAYADTFGNVYFGSADGEIIIVNEGKIKKMFLESGLPSNYVRTMAMDSSGTMIFGCSDKILMYEGGGFTVLDPPCEVLALAIAPDNTLYMSTRWGVFKESNGLIAELPSLNSDVGDFVTSLGFDSKGGLWAGTYRGGILKLESNFWLPFAYPGEVGRGPVRKLLFDLDDQIWVLFNYLDVCRFDGIRWKSYSVTDFASNEIREITLDESGTAVLLTEESLWRYSSRDQWKRLEVPRNAPSSYTTVTFDASGGAYLAGMGFLIFSKGDKWEKIGVEDGLGGVEVTDMSFDRMGFLWIGFRRGGLASLYSWDLE